MAASILKDLIIITAIMACFLPIWFLITRRLFGNGVVMKLRMLMAIYGTCILILVYPFGKIGLSLLSVSLELLGAITITLAANFIAYRIVIRPIKDFTHTAESIADGELTSEVNYRATDEFGTLAVAFGKDIRYLQEISGAAERLSAGDLTVEVEPRSEKDQFGRSFKEMIAHLRQIVAPVKESAGDLHATSMELSTTSNQVEIFYAQLAMLAQQGMENARSSAASTGDATSAVKALADDIKMIAQWTSEQSAAMNQMMATTEKMTASVSEVVGNAQTGVHEAGQAAEIAGQGAQTIQATIADMGRIRVKVDLSAQKVQEMGQRVEQIGAFIETIDSIASQTNLLALNAAIEAARAGESGKGFAVVADEVRKLADASSSAAKEIGEVIKGIQVILTDTLTSIKETTREVDLGVEKADQASAAIQQILQSAGQVQKQVNQISASARLMSDFAGDLNQTAALTYSFADVGKGVSEHLVETSQQIIAAVDRITEIVSASQENEQSVVAGMDQLNGQLHAVNSAAASLNQVAERLYAVTSMIRL